MALKIDTHEWNNPLIIVTKLFFDYPVAKLTALSILMVALKILLFSVENMQKFQFKIYLNKNQNYWG